MSAHGKGKHTHRPHSSQECTGARVSETHMGYLVQNTTKMLLKASCTLSLVLVHRKAEGQGYWSGRKHSACGLVGPYAPEELLRLRRTEHSKVNLREKKNNQTKKQKNSQPAKKTPKPNPTPPPKKPQANEKTPPKTPNTGRNQKPITQHMKTTYKTQQ